MVHGHGMVRMSISHLGVSRERSPSIHSVCVIAISTIVTCLIFIKSEAMSSAMLPPTSLYRLSSWMFSGEIISNLTFFVDVASSRVIRTRETRANL